MSSVNTSFMAVLNLTPDSFSDGGQFVEFGGNRDLLEMAREFLEDGASILDIGGESTGPGSKNVSLEEEKVRVIPAIEKIHAAFPEAILSIDTWKSEVAEAALKAGARMVNDVTAGRGDPRIFEVVARWGVPMVLMYSKQNSPRTDREVVHYEDVMKTVLGFLQERIAAAEAAGVKELWVDPGMGAFVSGEPAYSYEIIERIEELRVLGKPILVGTSRKGFLGEDRLGMTLWTTLQLQNKVDCLRVHDVLENATAVEGFWQSEIAT
ncbi:dihydropteroate synthase [Candidatus Peregrinibacteria bacterium]|nr:MAG: dihydropteroate synthase [Candidatus Peregrinibacteria bacterium]